MPIGTAPLRNRERDEVEAAADAQTIRLLEPDLIAAQKERIGELEAENDNLITAIQRALSALETNYITGNKSAHTTLKLAFDRDATTNQYLFRNRNEMLRQVNEDLKEENEALRAVAVAIAEYDRFGREYDYRDCDDLKEMDATFERKWQAVLNTLQAASAAGYLPGKEEVGK